ncbi:DUF6069 family protein [Streptomyces sp. NPDC046275]|uniref:DUF6069 family protein n=1 Tax=Streptomyces sp. NPDC046275 TaxID=3157201 RepID=UPI0033DC1872
MSARARRLGVVGGAVLAPVLVWLVTDPLLGHPLRITDGGQVLDIGGGAVAFLALLASLAGWGLLAALERFGARRPRTVWAWAAGAVLAVSFLPFTGGGMDAGTALALALMHLAVAAVLIPGLASTPPAAGPRTARA